METRANRVATLCEKDLLRLFPEQMKILREIIPFEKARCIAGPGESCCSRPSGNDSGLEAEGRDIKSDHIELLLDSLDLSGRQRLRAEEALSEGRGFWDRIGARAIIPIAEGKDSIGLVILEGVPHEISPIEAERLLPLLSSLLTVMGREKKQRLFCSGEAGLPEYVEKIAVTDPDQSLIRVGFKGRDMARWDCSIMETTEKRLNTLFQTDVEPVGLLPDSAWFLLESDPLPSHNSLANLIDTPIIPGFRTDSVIIHRCCYWPIIEQLPCYSGSNRVRLPMLLHLSRTLDTRIVSPDILKQIQKETGVDLLAFPLPSSAFVPSRKGVAIMIGLPLQETDSNGAATNREILSTLQTIIAETFSGAQGIQINSAGERAIFAFFQLQGSDREPDLFSGNIQKFHQALGHAVGQDVTAGIAPAWYPGVTPRTMASAAFWALWHARLLEENSGTSGEMATFDHLTMNVKGDVLVGWGDMKSGIRAYRAGVRINPREINLKNSLGVCLAASGRKAEAWKIFQKVLDQEPENYFALYNLSGLQEARGELESARESISRALRSNPDDQAGRLRLAQIQLSMGEGRHAIEICYDMLGTTPIEKSPLLILNLLGRALLLQGEWPEARKIFRAILKRRGRDPHALINLAKGYVEFERDRRTAQRLIESIKGAAIPESLQGDYRDLYLSLTQENIPIEDGRQEENCISTSSLHRLEGVKSD